MTPGDAARLAALYLRTGQYDAAGHGVPAVVLVAQGPLPAQAASRGDAEEGYGTVRILEPVSLAVGQPVDPVLLSMSTSG